MALDVIGGATPVPVPEGPLGRELPLPDTDGIEPAELEPVADWLPEGRPEGPARVVLSVGLEADIVPIELEAEAVLMLVVPIGLDADAELRLVLPMGFEAEAVPKLVLGTELEADGVVLELETLSCCGHAVAVAARASDIRLVYCMFIRKEGVFL